MNGIILCMNGCKEKPEDWVIVVITILKVLIYFIPYIFIAWTIAYYISWIIKDKKTRIKKNILVKKYFKKLALVTIIWLCTLIIYVLFIFIYDNPVAECWC